MMQKVIKNDHSGAILSFGELLLRICPDAGGKWLQNSNLPFHLGGAELNVASALALWGLPSKYFTALPDNGLSAQIINHLDEKHIDTSSVFYHGNRIGLFFLTKGQDMKHDALIYDRANSAFAQLTPGMVDWDKVLQGVSWFHFSAICPAISQNTADSCLEALRAASAKGITISVDLNYRAKLWQYGKTPVQIMPQLAQYCNLIMGNIWSAEKMLGIPVDAGVYDSNNQTACLAAALKTSEQIRMQFPACKAVANTFRFDATADIKYYTTLYTGGKFHQSKTYETSNVIDKVGSGDCFMAGLIYGFCKDMAANETLEFATAAAYEKLFVEGDATTKTVEEIKKAMKP
jgi:2-dehydro-3-deoxygluconokinase